MSAPMPGAFDDDEPRRRRTRSPSRRHRRSESQRRESRTRREARHSSSRSPTRRRSSKPGRDGEPRRHRRSDSQRRSSKNDRDGSERRSSKNDRESSERRRHRHSSSGEVRRDGSRRKSSSERRNRAAREPAVPQKASTPQRRKTTYRHGAYHDPDMDDSEDEVLPVRGGYRPTPQDDPEERPRRGKPAPAPKEAAALLGLGLDGNRDFGLNVEGDARDKRRHRKEEEAAARRAEREDAKRKKLEERQKRKSSGGVSGGILGMHEKKKRHQSMDSDDFDEEQEENVKRGCWLGCSKWFWILVACTVVVVIAIPAGVVGAKNAKKSAGENEEVGGTPDPALGLGKTGETLDPDDRDKIDTEYKNGILDPFTWADTKDFNTTFTAKEVGGLPIMGLFDDYDDSTQCNENVPPLNKKFPYGKTPIRGVNLGGWLSIEPFITPSFFKQFPARYGVVDEWTLTEKLGKKKAAETLEKHYKNFVNEVTFKEIRDAGLDHVRIPFGYWAVLEREDDNFVPKISWRYLLRGIEWARKYGLRVKLDLHSVPGGANGWNHSGRQGVINWVNGPQGAANAKQTLEVHQQLATFFSQPRYKNIITMYGLVNEPKMIELDVKLVLQWSEDAYDVIRSAGYEGQIVFGDGFRGLEKWKGAFPGKTGMILDVHQYTIFNINQIALTHSKKISFACDDWSAQMEASMEKSSGFGASMVGEWGQADTDCTEFLNNVGVGTRWEGDFAPNMTPACPDKKNCSCEMANGPPEDYTDEYKQFLLMFAEAQMDSFETSYGWMYWTWDTESSTQWSYKKSMAAGIIPQIAYERKFKCGDEIPDFAELGLPETY